MKKKLLFITCMGAALLAFAQDKHHGLYKVPSKPYLDKQEELSNGIVTSPGKTYTVPARKAPAAITNATVTKVPMGNAANILGGATRPGRPQLDVYPPLNIVTMTHRTCVTNCSHPYLNSGGYAFDYSKDGGATFATNMGPVYGPGPALARYPQGVIYNPAGNTKPDSAFIAIHGPSCSGCAGAGDEWIHYVSASTYLSDTLGNSASSKVEDFAPNLPSHGLIPPTMVITQQGVTWVADMGYDGSDYTDTILIRKGVWNSTTKIHDYTTTKLRFPVTLGADGSKNFSGALNIAFAPNGQIGYLSAIAHDSMLFQPDTANYIVIWKTADGGATWGSPKRISVDSVSGDLNANGKCYAFPETDGVVDKDGNYHMILNIHKYAGAGQISIVPGEFGMYSVYTKDQGATWKLKLLTKPMTFSSPAYIVSGSTPLQHNNQPQVSMTWAGDEIFYVWFDTDTQQHPGLPLDSANAFPNAYARYYDVASNSFGPVTNLTGGSSSAVQEVLTWGYVSYYSFGSAAPYTIPLAYQELAGGDGGVTNQFYYVHGAVITGIHDLENPSFNIADAYPNPTSGTATIEVDMKKPDRIFIEVSNMLGQILYRTNASLTTGTRLFTVDASKWKSGIYFYTVKSESFSVTKKLIRE